MIQQTIEYATYADTFILILSDLFKWEAFEFQYFETITDPSITLSAFVKVLKCLLEVSTA